MNWERGMMGRIGRRAAMGIAATIAMTMGSGPVLAQDAKDILPLTRGSWIMVREYDGQDLLYFTNILAWRCTVERVRIGVNGDGLGPLEMEPCHEDEVSPNEIKADVIMPYLTYPLGSVRKVSVEVTYPDGSSDLMDYERSDVLRR